ncbi:MAG: HDIG domain-containing protein [Bacteroidota bacterium]|nr:HDIG domain-containing protein [Bacteroidota bacterium]
MNKSLLRVYRLFNKLYPFVLFVVTVASIYLLFPKQVKFRYEFQKGKPWRHETLYAPFSFGINKPDAEIVEQNDSIRQLFVPFFHLNTSKSDEQIKLFNLHFEKTWADLQNTPSGHQILSTFNKVTIRNIYLDLLKKIYDAGIMEQSLEFHPELKSKNSLIRIKDTFAEEVPLKNVYSLKSAYFSISDILNRSNPSQFGPAFLHENLAMNRYLFPNLFYDEQKSKQVLQDQLNTVSLTQGMVQSGERVISRGDVVTDSNYLVLQSLKVSYEKGIGHNIKYSMVIIGQIMFIMVCIGALFMYIYQFRRYYYDEKKKIVSIMLSLFITIFFASLVIRTNFISLSIVPFTILAIIIRIFFDSRTAIFVYLITLLLVGFFAPNSYEFIFTQTLAGFVAVVSIDRIYRRSHLVWTAVFVTLTYSIVYFCLNIIQEGNIAAIPWTRYKWILANGILVTAAYPMIYIFEKIFGFVSDVTLIEISDTNNQLLRMLAEKAPGTFQHSIQVANIAEEAIRKIGGNPFLIRTGALYHDIGKAENPQYFIENQSINENPHNKLAYDKSAAIIIDHVSAGVKIARKHKLPEKIVDFIKTHHGTSKTGYFYRRYIIDHPGEKVDADKFSYPGPNPTSKELSVLMLADSVEAASRSLAVKNEESLYELIEQIFNQKINEGQLKNSDLTFGDITNVKIIFLEKLKNIYHVRIEYPSEK